ncbi:MAG: TonB-dependent receptor [Desulfobacterota bacterium]|nr:TonB-dependent receptor [Thermodesulfobacteriota bacterium]
MRRFWAMMIFLALPLNGFGSWMVWAEEKEEKLEEMVVTATRTEKELEIAPASVTVIKKEEIEKRGVKTLDSALNTTPGVFNRRGKGLMDVLSNVTLRGIPGEARTMVMMDGVPLNDAYVGNVVYGGLMPEDIERIEVVRGPFSSLYGGYAMGGVVHLISKMPEKREFTFKAGYGSHLKGDEAMDDYWKGYLSYGDRFKGFSFFVSYGYQATDGYPTDYNVQSSRPPAGITGWIPTTDTQGAIRYLIGHRGDNTWWDDSLRVRAGYDFSKVTKLRLSFLRQRYEYDYDDPVTYLRNAAGAEVWSYGTVRERTFIGGGGGRVLNHYNVGFETEVSPLKIKFSLGLQDVEKNWYVTPGTTAATTRFGGPGTRNETLSQNYHGDLQVTVPLFKRNLLTFGGSFRYGWANTEEHDLINWKDEDSKTRLVYQSKGKDRTYAFFLQDEIMILENLTAYLGVRFDRWETFDGYVNQAGTAGYPKRYGARDARSWSPKAALVYKPFERTTLRVSGGKAFRSPTTYDLYRTWVSAAGTTFAANPDLKPETTLSWDVGIDQGLWKGARVRAAYFENYLKDLIYRKTVTPTYREFHNAGKAEVKGVELEGEQRFDFGLKLFANFTYNDTEMKRNEANPASEGKKLTNVPERMFNVGADFEKGPFYASLIGRYVSKRFTDDQNRDRVNRVYGSHDPFFVVDARLSYKVLKFATLSLSIDNLFDKDYFWSYKAPGRSWFGEVLVKF